MSDRNPQVDFRRFREVEILADDGLRGRFLQATLRLPAALPATAANYKAPFFISDRKYEIVKAVKRNEVASGAGGTASIYVTPSGTAGGSGKLVTTFDLTATTTLQEGTLSATLLNRFIERGDSLTAAAADMADCADLTIVIYLRAL